MFKKNTGVYVFSIISKRPSVGEDEGAMASVCAHPNYATCRPQEDSEKSPAGTDQPEAVPYRPHRKACDRQTEVGHGVQRSPIPISIVVWSTRKRPSASRFVCALCYCLLGRTKSRSPIGLFVHESLELLWCPGYLVSVDNYMNLQVCDLVRAWVG